jgi:DedD protein
MSHLLDDDDHDLHGHPSHRELTLSTTAVLGIFFGLALLCALFFGFGYNMGSKARQAAQPTTPDAPDSGSTANFNSFKPAPGSPASQSPAGAYPPGSNSNYAPTTPASSSPATTAHSAPPPESSSAETPSPTPAPLAIHPAAPPATPPSTAPASATGTFVVQIAAVSHQEDADLLVGALHGKGYSVSAHSEPQDKLVHIQVGPFSNRKDAEAMRQRLLADGYNALVK